MTLSHDCGVKVGCEATPQQPCREKTYYSHDFSFSTIICSLDVSMIKAKTNMPGFLVNVGRVPNAAKGPAFV